MVAEQDRFPGRLRSVASSPQRELTRRWHGLAGEARFALLALVVLLAGAIAVRLWLMLDYGPAFVGFGDTHEYLSAAALGVFRDAQKPAGYPIFLAFLDFFANSLTFTILVQHLLGLATGLLLYGAVRHTGAPRWLGLLPAAVVFFGGTGLLLEHSLLADSLFAFLQALGLYAAVRALPSTGLRWALIAGLAIGLSFWVKTVALSSVVVVALVFLLAGEGGRGSRLRSAGALVASALGVILAYVVLQGLITGFWGLQRQDGWNLYGRVATFIDCSHFHPPEGTLYLCPVGQPGHRLPPAFYQYGRSTPAVEHFGGPSQASARANGLLERFSIAAIEHEPVAYAKTILRGLGFFVSPRAGEGYTPQTIREALLDPTGVRSVEPALRGLYPHARGYLPGSAGAGALDSYERHTRVQGLLLVLLAAAALIGTPLLSGRARAGAALFTLTAFASAAFAVAGNSYDARYGYPAFGPLAAGAALGAWGIATRLRRGTRARRQRRAHPRAA